MRNIEEFFSLTFSRVAKLGNTFSILIILAFCISFFNTKIEKFFAAQFSNSSHVLE